MCGIAGQALTHRDALPDPRTSEAMVTLLRHRGPDDEGVFAAPGIFLGHTRLSITGILRGHQPVTNESGTVLVVFNGEIYNHQELRRELVARGHRVQGDSDSAVLPHAYEEWGPAFPERLDGIFAIGVWDVAERRLYLCRDRFGVKPLYYAVDPDGIHFGSELKAVAAGRASAPELDAGAVGDYLAFGYIPGPRTILRGIRMLPPATLLAWREGDTTNRQYWTPAFDGNGGSGERAALDRIEGALTAAVARESLTETPVGAFLSGGLDSSAITALMAERLGRPFPTFHAAFEEPSFGEQEYARAVSRHFGTRHHEVLCSADHVPRLLPALVWHLDNPVSDVSALAEFMVADLARQSVKVVLSGDGGDEVLAGYPTYKADRIADALARVGLRSPVARLLGLVEPLVPAGTGKLGPREKLGRFRRGLAAAGGHPHTHWRTVFSEADRAALVVPEARPAMENTWQRAAAWLEGTEGWPALTRYQWLDMRVWLDGCVLRKVDALAMAHAIEVRVPFLDHRVVEACLSAPPSLRLRGWTEKYALRRIMARRLPESIRRRPKAPFQMPLDRWFRGPLAEFAREQLTAGGLTRLPLLSARAARQVLDDHLSGREAAGIKLWALVVLGSWVEHCLPRLRPAGHHPGAPRAVLGGRT
jgi:asparagine synthase (glutamine-hydrolysing)